MQHTERRLDVAALFRNSKHQPNRVTIISEAHSFEYGTACRDQGLNAGGFTCAARIAHESSLPREDLKVDFHFVLDLNHSATDTEGLDSKISLFENGVCRVRLAGLFHGQADRFGDTV